MLSATRQNTIMDTMLPAIFGDRRMSRLLAQLVFILAGGTLLAASAQFKVMVLPSPVPITGQKTQHRQPPMKSSHKKSGESRPMRPTL